MKNVSLRESINQIGAIAIAKPTSAGTIKPAAQESVGQAVDAQGRLNAYMNVDLSAGSGAVNKWVQFDYTNGGTGTEPIRVGSLVGQPDAYLEWGLPVAAQDGTNVADQRGAGCLFTRGWSKLTVAKAALITELQVSSSDLTQLQSEIGFNYLNWDGTMTPTIINMGATEKLSDQRDNLLINKGSWVLDPNSYFEFKSVTGKSLTVRLFIAGVDNVGQMVPLS